MSNLSSPSKLSSQCGDAEKPTTNAYDGFRRESQGTRDFPHIADRAQTAELSITGDANTTTTTASLVNTRDGAVVQDFTKIPSRSSRSSSAVSLDAAAATAGALYATASKCDTKCAPPVACPDWPEPSTMLTAASATVGENDEQNNTPMLSHARFMTTVDDIYAGGEMALGGKVTIQHAAGSPEPVLSHVDLAAREIPNTHREVECAAVPEASTADADDVVVDDGPEEKEKAATTPTTTITTGDETSVTGRSEEEEDEVTDDNYHLESGGGAPVTVRLMHRIQKEQHRQRVRVRRNMHPASRALRSSAMLRPRRAHSHAQSSATSSSWRYSTTTSSASCGDGEEDEAMSPNTETRHNAQADALTDHDACDEAYNTELMDVNDVIATAVGERHAGAATQKSSSADTSSASHESRASSEPILTPLRLQRTTSGRTSQSRSNVPTSASSLPRRRSSGVTDNNDVGAKDKTMRCGASAGVACTISSARPVGRKRGGDVFDRLSTLTSAPTTLTVREAAVQATSTARKVRAFAPSSRPPPHGQPAQPAITSAPAATVEQVADEARRERRVKPLLDSVRAVTMAASARQESEQHQFTQQTSEGQDGSTNAPPLRSRRPTLPQPTHFSNTDTNKRRAVAATPPQASAQLTDPHVSDGGHPPSSSQPPATPPTPASRPHRRLRTILQHSPVTGAQAMLSLIEAHHTRDCQATAARSHTPRLLPELITAEEACRVVTVVFDLDETLCNNRCLTPALLRPGAISLLRHLRSLYPSPQYKQPPVRRPGTRLYDQSLPGKVLSPTVAYQPRRPSASVADVVVSSARSGLLLEMVLWTASVEAVARRVVQRLDPEGTVFDYAIYRDARWYSDGGYTKNLRHLGRDMERVVIVENAPGSVLLNPKHAILVHDFVRNKADRQLYVVRAVLTDWLHHISTVLCPPSVIATDEKQSDDNDTHPTASHAHPRDGVQGRCGANPGSGESPGNRLNLEAGVEGGGLHTATKPNAEEGGESVMPQPYAQRKSGLTAPQDSPPRLLHGAGGRLSRTTRHSDAEALPSTGGGNNSKGHTLPSPARERECTSGVMSHETSLAAAAVVSHERPSGTATTKPSGMLYPTVDSFLAHHPFIVPETNYIRLSAIREAMQRFIASCSDGTAVESTRPSLTRRSTSLADEVLNRLPGYKPLSVQPDVPPPPVNVQHLLASRGNTGAPLETTSVVDAKAKNHRPQAGVARPRKVYIPTSRGATEAPRACHAGASLTVAGTRGTLPRWPREAERLQLKR